MLSKEDFVSIARLHKDGIQTGFLSTFGLNFLAALYRGIDNHPDSCVLVERNEQGDVAGFVSGTVSVPRCYRYVITRNFIRLGIPVVFRMLSFSNLKKLIETLLYPSREKKSGRSVEAELLSMAVHKDTRGQGVGKKLVAQLDEFYRSGGKIDKYKVVTLSGDAQSNGFYKKAGFEFAHSFQFHENVMNEYHRQL